MFTEHLTSSLAATCGFMSLCLQLPRPAGWGCCVVSTFVMDGLMVFVSGIICFEFLGLAFTLIMLSSARWVVWKVSAEAILWICAWSDSMGVLVQGSEDWWGLYGVRTIVERNVGYVPEAGR